MKYCGMIGFEETVRSDRNKFDYREQIVERMYYGDITRLGMHSQTSGGTNDNINLSNEISIVADPYVRNHYHSMRYIIVDGTKWKVSNVEVQFPRLILSIGGLYHENQ